MRNSKEISDLRNLIENAIINYYPEKVNITCVLAVLGGFLNTCLLASDLTEQELKRAFECLLRDCIELKREIQSETNEND